MCTYMELIYEQLPPRNKVLSCRAQGRGLGMSVEDLERRGIFSERRGRRRTARTKEDKEAVRLVRASSRV